MDSVKKFFQSVLYYSAIFAVVFWIFDHGIPGLYHLLRIEKEYIKNGEAIIPENQFKTLGPLLRGKDFWYEDAHISENILAYCDEGEGQTDCVFRLENPEDSGMRKISMRQVGIPVPKNASCILSFSILTEENEVETYFPLLMVNVKDIDDYNIDWLLNEPIWTPTPGTWKNFSFDFKTKKVTPVHLEFSLGHGGPVFLDHISLICR